MKPKVSVIVPVYNVKKYLSQCLDSLVNQTVKEIEIICVNDGSTDNSGEILKLYQKKDNRIKVITKENGGLSSARNAGMKVASGEYIGFVDSDDWVDEKMYEKLYSAAKKENTDITICSISLYNDKEAKEAVPDVYYTLGAFDLTFDDRVFSPDETKDILFRICVTAVDKIYKRSFLRRIKAKFPEKLIFEDNPFFLSNLFECKSDFINTGTALLLPD